jgi:hypothetical protein
MGTMFGEAFLLLHYMVTEENGPGGGAGSKLTFLTPPVPKLPAPEIMTLIHL